jgi:predicted O-linked N-acetylglucosamine transferase (SPINDLY family)
MDSVKGTVRKELKKIIEDTIDILSDMAQTGIHRLDTFALKPAPIQISTGYPNTSGLAI